MKKLLLSAIAMVASVGAWAYTPALTADYSVAGYKAKAYYNIANENVDGMCPTGTYNESTRKWSPEFCYRGSGYGLFNYGSGSRGADVTLSVSNTDLLLLEFKDTQNRSVTVNSVSHCTKNNTATSGDIIAWDVNEDATTVNINVGRGGCIIAISVLEKDNNATTATYTINYLLNGEGEPLKTVSDEVAVGTTIVTEASFFVGEAKYIRADEQVESFVVSEEGNTVNVSVRNAETFSYVLMSNVGGQIASGSGLEGETVTLPYSRYIVQDGSIYEAGATKSEYRTTIELTEDGVEKVIDYSVKEDINAVFFAEGENIEGMTVSTADNIPVRASNAQAGVASEDVVITTLQPGKYILHVGAFTSKSSQRNIYVGYGTIQLEFSSSGNLNETASDEIVLTLPTPIKYFGTTSSGDAQFDYIWIEKTGDVTEEDITLKSVFLKPGVWAADGARFAAYAYADGNNTVWADFAAVEGDEGVYTATVNAEYTGLILVRMNGETTENNWDNKWNQTDDINFAEAADSTLYTITGWGEGENAKSTFEASKYVAPEPEPEPVLNTYTVQFINGAKWNKVNAYAWSGEGEQAVPVKAWPGTELKEPADTVINEVTYGLYTYTIEAEAAPEFIIFNNAEENVDTVQTENLVFKADSIYTYGVPEPEPEPVLNTYTVQFINGAKWNKVNAYAWSGEGEQAVPVTAWPGTELTEPADTVINEVTYGLYTYTIEAEAAPEFIIFNNAEENVDTVQTENLVFKADSIYTYGVPEPEPIVETAYYLIGAFNEWSQDTKVAFTKGDDGNFTLTYTFSGQFKILDQDGNWLGAGTENNYYQLTEDNSDVELVDGNNLYLESEAEYTLTIDGSIMTVTGFPAEPDPVYTVVGTYVVDGVETDSIFGQSWAILEANDMEADQNSDGCYTKTFNVKLLPAGTILYKVVKNHSWTINWGFPTGNDGNADYVVKTDDPDKPAMENVTITFTFNPDVAINGEECHLLCTVTGTPTGISNVAGQRTEQFIYSVQGVKLQKVQKGLNIINGRKVVVK